MTIEEIDKEIKRLKELRSEIITEQNRMRVQKRNSRSAWKLVLRRLRHKNNLSLSELGSMIGVSKQTVHKWETGKSVIPQKRIDEINKVLK